MTVIERVYNINAEKVTVDPMQSWNSDFRRCSLLCLYALAIAKSTMNLGNANNSSIREVLQVLVHWT
jgi:hypothetical protein